MAYEIGATESPGAAIRRIAGEQTGKALGEVRDEKASVARRIHEVRKRCKRIRAAVRLVRPGFGRYAGTNRRIRDIARRLSGHRDARVMADLVDELCAGDSGREPTAHPAVRWYRTRVDIAEEHGRTVLAELEPVLADMAVAVEGWAVDDICIDDAVAGLRKTLSRAEGCYSDIGARASAEAFHEWRKRSKYHRLHIRLLANVLPDDAADRRERFERLDGLIGDEHDCSALIASLQAEPSFLSQRAEVRELIAITTRRRRKLRKQVLEAARGLFDEPAEEFCSRLRDSWRAKQQ